MYRSILTVKEESILSGIFEGLDDTNGSIHDEDWIFDTPEEAALFGSTQVTDNPGVIVGYGVEIII